jgi:hypothetical protein
VSAATYLIGPADLFTSGDLEKDAATVDMGVSDLDAVIEGNTNIPGSFLDAWQGFQLAWKGWYGDKFQSWDTFAVALNDSNRDGLISYENQLATWQSQAAGYGATPAGPIVQPSTGSPSFNPFSGIDTTSIVVVAVAIIAVLVFWKAA